MPRLKVEDDELDIEELDAAEVSDNGYTPYTGKQPPKGTVLYGVVKKIWWTYNSNNVRMLTVIFQATSESGQYEGLAVWERLTMSAAAKFRWQPFLEATGITLKDLKNKLIVEDEDDPSRGTPVIKIGKFVVGDENLAAVRIITDRELYNEEWQTKVGSWLEWEDPDEEEDEEDDEYEDELEEEEEEEPEPPKRRVPAAKSASSSKAGAARRKPARQPEPEPEEDEDEEELEDYEDEEEEDEEEPPARPARKAPAKAARPTAAPRAAKPVAGRIRTGSATPARGGKVGRPVSRKGRSSAGDEPPF